MCYYLQIVAVYLKYIIKSLFSIHICLMIIAYQLFFYISLYHLATNITLLGSKCITDVIFETAKSLPNKNKIPFLSYLKNKIMHEEIFIASIFLLYKKFIRNKL